MGKKLYVGNLSYNVSSSDLEQMFSAHGTVDSAQVIEDRSTGQSKGFGFVEMGSSEDADKAIRSGKASVVTDGIERFDATGIRLTSGERLDADIVVTTEDSVHDWDSYPYRIDGGADWG